MILSSSVVMAIFVFGLFGGVHGGDADLCANVNCSASQECFWRTNCTGAACHISAKCRSICPNVTDECSRQCKIEPHGDNGCVRCDCPKSSTVDACTHVTCPDGKECRVKCSRLPFGRCYSKCRDICPPRPEACAGPGCAWEEKEHCQICVCP